MLVVCDRDEPGTEGSLASFVHCYTLGVLPTVDFRAADHLWQLSGYASEISEEL